MQNAFIAPGRVPNLDVAFRPPFGTRRPQTDPPANPPRATSASGQRAARADAPSPAPRRRIRTAFCAGLFTFGMAGLAAHQFHLFAAHVTPAPIEAPAPYSTGSSFSSAFYSHTDDPAYRIYGASGATWLIGAGDDAARAGQAVRKAAARGQLPVLVQYDIPGRDGGAGGAFNLQNYLAEVESNARAIGNGRAMVVIEPDALALNLAPQPVQAAVHLYRTLAPDAQIYIDAGNSNWAAAPEMAQRLLQAGIEEADGFSLNVSAFEWTRDEEEFGDKILTQLTQLDGALATKKFIIDTSRNGSGPGVDQAGQPTWGDPLRAAQGGPVTTGPLPTLHPADPHAAAYVWIKAPGYGDNRIHPASEFGGTAWVTPNPHPAPGRP